MARRHAKKQGEAEIDMTPMLDVVFIMLIFFIVATSFVKESGRTVDKPFAEEATLQKDANIFIAVTEKDEIVLEKRILKPGEVRNAIERLRAENSEGDVVITADKKAKSGTVMKVVDAIKAAGVAHVSIAAEID
jgi:biopolymer transport protein ExbD